MKEQEEENKQEKAIVVQKRDKKLLFTAWKHMQSTSTFLSAVHTDIDLDAQNLFLMSKCLNSPSQKKKIE